MIWAIPCKKCGRVSDDGLCFECYIKTPRLCDSCKKYYVSCPLDAQGHVTSCVEYWPKTVVDLLRQDSRANQTIPMRKDEPKFFHVDWAVDVDDCPWCDGDGFARDNDRNVTGLCHHPFHKESNEPNKETT